MFSSDGRADALQASGRWFDPSNTYHKLNIKVNMRKAIVVYTTEVEHRSKNISRIRREIKKEVGRDFPVIVLPDGCTLEVNDIESAPKAPEMLTSSISKKPIDDGDY